MPSPLLHQNGSQIVELSKQSWRFRYHLLQSPADEDKIGLDEDSSTKMKLLIRRLDDSFFNVRVSRLASVGELKAALEITVNELARNELGKCEITWNQVWQNFCLCYMHQKLLNDSESLRSFGIQDEDQVQLWIVLNEWKEALVNHRICYIQLNFVHHVQNRWHRKKRAAFSCFRFSSKSKHGHGASYGGKKRQRYFVRFRRRCLFYLTWIKSRCNTRKRRRTPGLLARVFCL